MSKTLNILLAPAACALLSLGIFMQSLAIARAGDARPFHDRVSRTVASLPMAIGPWIGTDGTIPPSAQQLLRPNALLGRMYRDASGGRAAKLIVVQCRDPRDMSGHYPPNCYPASGWDQPEEPGRDRVELWGSPREFSVYQFSRREGGRVNTIVIYGLFVLPGRGVVLEMSQVRSATGDYRARPFGAAQIQVVMDAGLSVDERRKIVAEILGPLGELVGLLGAEPGQEGTP